MIIIQDAKHLYHYVNMDDVTETITYHRYKGSIRFKYNCNHELNVNIDECFTMIEQQPITDLTLWKANYDDELITIIFIDDKHYHHHIKGYQWNESLLELAPTSSILQWNYPLLDSFIAQLDKNNCMIYSNCICNDAFQYTTLRLENMIGYRLLGISIMVIGNRIYIQDTDLLKVNLSPLSNELLAKTTFNHQKRITYHHLNQTFQPPTLKQQLPNIPTIPIRVTTPLWVSMGPMLIMGIATLTSSSLMAIQRYYNGQDIVDVIPTLILPLMLIISTLLFQPCIRYFDTKRIKKENEARFDQFNFQFANLTMIGYEALANLSNYMERYFPTSMTLIQTFDYAHMNVYHYDPSQLSITLGKSNIQSQFIIEGDDQFVEDKRIAQSFKDYVTKLKSLYTMYPLLLQENKRYLIEDDEDNIYKNILIQFMCRYSAKDLAIQFVVDSKFMAMHSELFNIPYCYDQQQWLVFNHAHEIKQFKERNSIIFSMVPIDEHIQYPVFYIKQVQAVVDIIIRMDKSGCCYLEENGVITQIDMDDLSKMNLSTHAFNWFNESLHSHAEFNIYQMNGYFDFNAQSLKETYANNEYNDALLTQFATNETGIFTLDLSEKKSGPHGLVIGATGGGKSETLLSMIVSLLMKYSPTKLQLLVIDFKGSSLALALKQFPHFVGSIDNLSLHECQRFIAALKYQSQMRQQLFKCASDENNAIIADIQQYRVFAKNHPNYPQLAHLLVVIDEFAQVKNLAYAFVEEIIQLARIGRSLGIHLLLSTQKPSGVINDQILSNMSYKICLKVNERNDSLDIINTDKALYLKNPGSFYCLNDTGLSKAQAFYIKGFDDPTHKNHKGKIKDVFDNKSANYTSIENHNTYLDTIITVIQSLNEQIEPLLLPKVQPYERKNRDGLIEIGEYDAIETVQRKTSLLPHNFNNALVVGSCLVCDTIKNTILSYFMEYHYQHYVVVIASQYYDWASLSITMNDTDTVIEVLTCLEKTNKHCLLVIEDSLNHLEDAQAILQVIKKIKANTNIQLLLMVTTMTPYVYRYLQTFDYFFIDSKIDINVKSIFFSKVNTVSEYDDYFIYDNNGNYIALNTYHLSQFKFNALELFLSACTLPLTSTTFCKTLFTGDDASNNNCIITAYNDALLQRIRTEMKKYKYPIVDDLTKKGIHIITLSTFIDTDSLKTIYYDFPLYFVGPGVKQQYVFPLQNYKEHDYKKAYLLHLDKVSEVRWFDL